MNTPENNSQDVVHQIRMMGGYNQVQEVATTPSIPQQPTNSIQMVGGYTQTLEDYEKKPAATVQATATKEKPFPRPEPATKIQMLGGREQRLTGTQPAIPQGSTGKPSFSPEGYLHTV